MILFPIPTVSKKEKAKFIGNVNIQSPSINRLTNEVQLLSQHQNSVKIWESLLSSPSHFDTNLSKQSGYHFDPNVIADQAKNKHISIILSEDPITSSILEKNEHLSIIDNSLQKVKDYDIDIDNLSVLGIQKHMCSYDDYSLYMNSMFNILRLSDIRNDYGVSEVVLRQSDRVVFDLNSIRKSDLRAQQNAGHCGLSIEEACRMMRYIGSVEQLKTLEICSIDFSESTHSSDYQAISLLIWYMMEGMTFRKNKKEAPQVKQFIVYPEGLDLPVYFYNESSSDKWWINTTEEMRDLKACSPLDYENARNGKYSDRLMKILDLV